VIPPDRPRAADVAAFFDGARLTLARQLAGLRKSDLAQLLDMSPTAVAAWESGAKRPTAVTVARLALSLGVDLGFFAMRADDVAALSATPHFRSLRSTTQLARDQAFAYGQLAVDIATSLEKHVECPDPDVPSFPADPDVPSFPAESDVSSFSGEPGVSSFSSEPGVSSFSSEPPDVPVSPADRDAAVIGASPEQAARRVRERWGMTRGPAPHLVRLLEHHGVLVVFSPPQAANVDAYSFDSRLRPVVVLNPVKHDYYRQRFDVAHELGHLVMHTDAEPGGRTVEDQANRFAAEFLMPAAEIRDELPATMNAAAWQALARGKERWGTSIQALLYRARRLGALTEVSYRNAMATLTARGWRRREPGLVTVLEQPSMLPRALELLAAEGISEHDLRDQCRVPAELFQTVTSRQPRPAPAAVGNVGAVPHDTHVSVVTSLFR
jgi:Zn-dependent peptidase ImmA (M78 family)/transcriptional regulator with XRE-family HTH domain